jgi:cytoskeleton protein RodZ
MQGTADIVPLEEERSKRTGEPPRLDDAGGMLRAARTDAGLSLEDVSAATNIKPEKLAAVEAMDLASLPAQPYALGFVRTYATFLNLPAAPLVQRYRDEAGWSAVPAPKIAPPPRDLGTTREASLLAVLLVVGLILWLGWQIVQSFAPEAEVAAEGFPLTDREEPARVTYEVESGSDAVTVDRPEEAVDAAPVAEVARTGEVASPETASVSLVPLVLLPTGAAEEAVEPAPISSAESRPQTIADVLNEQLLAETATDFPQAEPVRQAAPALPPLPVPEPVAEPRVRAAPAPSAETRRAEVVPARLTSPVSPVYPTRCESRASDEEVVTVGFGVSRLGKVVNPQVTDSTNGCFDQAALSAVARFGFEPAREGGRRVASEARTTRIVFRKP